MYFKLPNICIYKQKIEKVYNLLEAFEKMLSFFINSLLKRD